MKGIQGSFWRIWKQINVFPLFLENGMVNFEVSVTFQGCGNYISGSIINSVGMGFEHGFKERLSKGECDKVKTHLRIGFLVNTSTR